MKGIWIGKVKSCCFEQKEVERGRNPFTRAKAIEKIVN